MREALARMRIRTSCWRCLAGLFVLALVLTSCSLPDPTVGMSDSGHPLMIVIARQPVYAQASCSDASPTMLVPGENVVDLGTTGTNCEQIVFARDGFYHGLGYLPVYGMRRAAGGVRCRAAACVLHVGPASTLATVGTLSAGAAARGYGTATTNAIITDGDNYSWWQVIDPASGKRADAFGPSCQVF